MVILDSVLNNRLRRIPTKTAQTYCNKPHTFLLCEKHWCNLGLQTPGCGPVPVCEEIVTVPCRKVVQKWLERLT